MSPEKLCPNNLPVLTLAVRLMDKKFGQQDAWNSRMQRHMEAAVERHHKLDLLEKQVAALQAKLKCFEQQ